MTTRSQNYPKHWLCGSHLLELRPRTVNDDGLVCRFYDRLPEHDWWMAYQMRGHDELLLVADVLALNGGEVVAQATVTRYPELIRCDSGQAAVVVATEFQASRLSWRILLEAATIADRRGLYQLEMDVPLEDKAKVDAALDAGAYILFRYGGRDEEGRSRNIVRMELPLGRYLWWIKHLRVLDICCGQRNTA